MNLPIKYGDMYIKFDENNLPEYGFVMANHDHIIEKFVKLCDKQIDTIVLPKLENDEVPLNSSKFKYQMYLEGKITLAYMSFQGVKNAKIIVPFENSINFLGAFEKDANIELVLPENLTLKHIHCKESTLIEYCHSEWTIIADKKLSEPLYSGRDEWSICDEEKIEGIKINYSSDCLKNESNQSVLNL